MRISRFILALFISGTLLVIPSAALPVEPDIDKLLEKASEPPVEYPLARAGWDSRKIQVGPVPNPVYEKMRYPWTPAGLRAQLIAYAMPDWRVLALFGLLIFTLRYYRYMKPQELERQRQAEVVTFPLQQPSSAEEAA